MEAYIKKRIEDYGGVYVSIEDEESLLNIYNFYKRYIDEEYIDERYINEGIKKEPNGIECLYYAYLFGKKKKRELHIKYLAMSIKKGCSFAIENLVEKYINKERYLNYREFDLLKKYYEIEIEKGDVRAMRSLGYYHQHSSKDYAKMKKYYEMAIEKGDSLAMKYLGYYYGDIEKNYIKMKEYYEMAIEKGNSGAMNNLAHYYEHIEKNDELMEKYYKMSFEKGYAGAMNNLGHHHEYTKGDYDLAKKYYIMAVENGGEKNLFLQYCKKYKDPSFLEFFNFSNRKKKIKKEDFISLMSIFEENIFLPKKYYSHFLNVNIIFNDSVSQRVKNKQFILGETGIWPLYYKDSYMIQFMALLTVRRSPLPKDLIYLIAGYLFV